jgi:hypothetical protein
VPGPDKNKDESTKPAGRVRHDSTGRAVWEWAAESGRHAIDSTSRLLKRLDLPGLTLADDEKKKKRTQEEEAGKPAPPTFGGAREADAAANTRRSFDPYDTRTPLKPAAPKPAAKPAARITQPVRKKPGFFARLLGRK